MAKAREIYKCNLCGNIVEVLHGGVGALVCCGEEMPLLEAKTAESSTEKHVPFVAREGEKYVVKVGENALHPMEEIHYIEWIELEVDGKIYKKYFSPGDTPVVEFEVPEGSSVYAKEYCNLHGLWEKK